MDRLTELLTELVAALALNGSALLPPFECYYYEGPAMHTSELLDDIIRREGGYVDHPADPGGATNYGVTQRAWSAYRKSLGAAGSMLPLHVRDINERMAREFYLDEYVQPTDWMRDDELAALYIDSAINHGETRVARWLQLAADVQPDGKIGPVTKAAVNERASLVYRELLRTRLKFYAQIASDQLDRPGGDPQAVFLRGWINRACEFVR